MSAVQHKPWLCCHLSDWQWGSEQKHLIHTPSPPRFARHPAGCSAFPTFWRRARPDLMPSNLSQVETAMAKKNDGGRETHTHTHTHTHTRTHARTRAHTHTRTPWFLACCARCTDISPESEVRCIAIWSTRPRLEVLAAADGQIFALSREEPKPVRSWCGEHGWSSGERMMWHVAARSLPLCV